MKRSFSNKNKSHEALKRVLAFCLCALFVISAVPVGLHFASADDNLSEASTTINSVDPETTTVASDDTSAVDEDTTEPTSVDESATEPATQAADTEDGSTEGTTAATINSNFKPEMSFIKLQQLASNNATVTTDKTVSVKIEEDGTESDGSIPIGKISSNAPSISGKEYKGAYVVTTKADGTKTVEEISYVGSYSEGDDAYVYYSFADIPNTGVLLTSEQYIKLVYKTTVSISYEVRLNSISGESIGEKGGSFVSPVTKVDRGDSINIRFTPAKNASSGDADYRIKEMQAVYSDGTIEAITLDSDNMATLASLGKDVRLVAVVEKIEKYHLIDAHTSTDTRGHICWAGNTSEKNSNVTDPYSVDPSLFCSYDVAGSSGTVGANVMATPGGTIYFVMYSQTGDKWEFERLLINGVFVDAVCDGQIHATDIGNGMTVYFRSLGDEQRDSHLSSNANKDRSKFECWVTNVSDDIRVDYRCESNQREVLTLVQADGVDRVVASSFDRTTYIFKNTDFWDGIYNGEAQADRKATDFPNCVWTSADSIGKQLVNEYFGSNKSGLKSSDNDHTSVDYEHSSSGYGSRYVYFATKVGYDPTTMRAYITGQDTALDCDNIANLVTGKASSHFGVFSTDTNKSVATAKKAGYNWFVYYTGVGIDFRNLSLAVDPYSYFVEYDLDGGSIDGSDSYTDSAKYTIEDGKNRIILPTTTPEKEGYIFEGWQLVPTNQEYADMATPLILDVAGKFVINENTYKYGLVTEKTSYELDGVAYTDYNAVSGGNHRFVFKALWKSEDDETEKANYTIKTYKEVNKNTEGAEQKNGKWYTLTSEERYVGLVGETIIGIPGDPEAGYVLSDKSITKLENFKADGNTDNELVYYYDSTYQDLTVTEKVEGTYANYLKTFDVTITLTPNGDLPVVDIDDYIATGALNGLVCSKSDDGKSITVTINNMGRNDTQTLTIPYGWSYAVEGQTDDSAYSVTYNVDGTEAGTLTGDTSVDVIFTREDITPTGVLDSTLFQTSLLGFVVLLGGTFVGVKVFRRKRNSV
jgi:hypothetical protein